MKHVIITAALTAFASPPWRILGTIMKSLAGRQPFSIFWVLLFTSRWSPVRLCSGLASSSCARPSAKPGKTDVS